MAPHHARRFRRRGRRGFLHESVDDAHDHRQRCRRHWKRGDSPRRRRRGSAGSRRARWRIVNSNLTPSATKFRFSIADFRLGKKRSLMTTAADVWSGHCLKFFRSGGGPDLSRLKISLQPAYSGRWPSQHQASDNQRTDRSENRSANNVGQIMCADIHP